jgi:ABC-type transporter MlaC component
LGLIFALLIASPVHAASCAGADTVKGAANAFIAAARSGSTSGFASALARYTNVEALALFALGKYRGDLPADRRSEYVRNAQRYMAAFLADNAGRFSGAAAIAIESCNGNLIQTSVSGGSDIVWKIGGGLVQDVKVSGIWLAPQLRQKFLGIIRRNHGYLSSLLDYLARGSGGAEQRQKKS